MASTSKRARLDCQHETDDESEKTVCDEKRAKKKPVFQKCREEYFQTWPFFKPSPKGEDMIYCKICDRHFSIKHGHGGAYDCEKHLATAMHQTNSKDVKPCKTIAAMFTQTQQSDAVKQADNIIKAEIAMTEMIAGDSFRYKFGLLF